MAASALIASTVLVAQEPDVALSLTETLTARVHLDDPELFEQFHAEGIAVKVITFDFDSGESQQLVTLRPGPDGDKSEVVLVSGSDRIAPTAVRFEFPFDDGPTESLVEDQELMPDGNTLLSVAFSGRGRLSFLFWSTGTRLEGPLRFMASVKGLGGQWQEVDLPLDPPAEEGVE